MFLKSQIVCALAGLAFDALVAKASAAEASQPDTAKVTAQVDEVVRQAMDQQRIPGLSLALIRDGRLVLAKAYGLANVELQVPATVETIYQIQSITKSFTATGIMMLVEAGKIDLDKTVGTYLSGTPESWREITIRQLLTHTSGIKDFINDPTASLRLDVTEEEVLQATAPRPLNFQPGEKYAYSNTNYHLLAMIIRNLTGKSYGDFLHERVLAKLGMGNTAVISLKELIPQRASGYRMTAGGWRNGEYIAESILAYGGGGLRSTVLDMVKWDAALYTESLLTKASLEEMWTPATLNNGKATDYGFGWRIQPVRGHRWVWHTGGHATGFSTIISRFPDDRLTAVVFTNCAGMALDRLSQRIAGVLEPGLAPLAYRPIKDEVPQITSRMQALYDRWVAGEPDSKAFTPELAEEFGSDEIEYRVECYGPLKSLVLVERTTEDDLRRFRYLAAFQSRQLVLAIGLNQNDQIAQWRFESQ